MVGGFIRTRCCFWLSMCVWWHVHRLDLLAIDLECRTKALGGILSLLMLKSLELLLKHVQVSLRHCLHAKGLLVVRMLIIAWWLLCLRIWWETTRVRRPSIYAIRSGHGGRWVRTKMRGSLSWLNDDMNGIGQRSDRSIESQSLSQRHGILEERSALVDQALFLRERVLQ